jgi:hypothetical protein
MNFKFATKSIATDHDTLNESIFVQLPNANYQILDTNYQQINSKRLIYRRKFFSQLKTSNFPQNKFAKV